MKIKSSQVLKNLLGKNIKNDDDSDYKVGQGIGDALLRTDRGNKMKNFILARKFYEEDEVNVDSADLKHIVEVVENDKGMTIVNGQILELIEKWKMEPKEKKK